jgi:hypothetical protein
MTETTQATSTKTAAARTYAARASAASGAHWGVGPAMIRRRVRQYGFGIDTPSLKS